MWTPQGAPTQKRCWINWRWLKNSATIWSGLNSGRPTQPFPKSCWVWQITLFKGCIVLKNQASNSLCRCLRQSLKIRLRRTREGIHNLLKYGRHMSQALLLCEKVRISQHQLCQRVATIKVIHIWKNINRIRNILIKVRKRHRILWRKTWINLPRSTN